MYTPTEIDISLEVAAPDVERCPNCLLADVTVLPADKKQRYFETLAGSVWGRAESYEDEGFLLSPDVTVKLYDDGVFRAVGGSFEIPTMRVFARDDNRGGMVEQLLSTTSAGGWYSRVVEWIDGVGMAEGGGDIRVRVVPGGEQLTSKHLILGNMAYDLYTVSCSVSVWLSEPTWQAGTPYSIVQTPDHILTLAEMTLIDGAQPYFENTFVLPVTDPVISGTIYAMPVFTIEYADSACEALSGALGFGPVPWVVSVYKDSTLRTYNYVGKVVIP